MIAYLLIGFAVLIGAAFAARWFMQAEPAVATRALRWSLVAIGSVLAVALLVARLPVLATAVAVLVLTLLRDRWFRGFMRYWLGRAHKPRGPGPSGRTSSRGQTSEVATRFVKMTLYHDTGDMTGVVCEGAHEGRRLDDLDLGELVALHRTCVAEDEQSAAVLEAYLDRRFGAEWREAAGAQGASSGAGSASAAGAGMTVEEAREVLGVAADASPEEIRRAHRELMQKMHPDRGGSTYFAAKLNQARAVLLGE